MLLARGKVKLAMYTRQDLMRILGISYRQLRNQLDALAAVDGLLAGQVQRGPKGRLEYSPAVLDMLKELNQLAQLAGNQGKDFGQAAKELAEKVHRNAHQKPFAQIDLITGNQVNLVAQVKLLEARLRDKDELIHELREEVTFLRRRVEELTPLALPRPRSRLLAWLWPAKRKAV